MRTLRYGCRHLDLWIGHDSLTGKWKPFVVVRGNP